MQARIYAQALYTALRDADSSRHGDIIARLFARMRRHGHGKLARHVAKEHAMLIDAARRRDACTLSVASEGDTRAALGDIQRRYPDVPLENCQTVVDESLIGGWRLEAGGKVADASYKQKLVALYNRFSTKA